LIISNGCSTSTGVGVLPLEIVVSGLEQYELNLEVLLEDDYAHVVDGQIDRRVAVRYLTYSRTGGYLSDNFVLLWQQVFICGKLGFSTGTLSSPMFARLSRHLEVAQHCGT
jgi:hypothetical protein